MAPVRRPREDKGTGTDAVNKKVICRHRMLSRIMHNSSDWETVKGNKESILKITRTDSSDEDSSADETIVHRLTVTRTTASLVRNQDTIKESDRISKRTKRNANISTHQENISGAISLEQRLTDLKLQADDPEVVSLEKQTKDEEASLEEDMTNLTLQANSSDAQSSQEHLKLADAPTAQAPLSVTKPGRLELTRSSDTGREEDTDASTRNKVKGEHGKPQAGSADGPPDPYLYPHGPIMRIPPGCECMLFPVTDTVCLEKSGRTFLLEAPRSRGVLPWECYAGVHHSMLQK